MKSDVKHFLELLWGMTLKELMARYKNTFFGFLWVVINPIIQMLIIGFVFKFFISQSIENYYYYLFIGLLTWDFFSLSLNKGTPSIVYERSLIKKAKFFRSVIPLSIIFSNLIHTLIAISLLSIPIAFLGTFGIGKIIYILVAFFLLVVFTSGLCLLTSALNVRYRDINFFVQSLLMVWFYLNPIVYTLSMIPYKYYWLWRFNPMTSILQLLQYGFLDKPLPGVAMITINSLLIMLIFVIGVLVFGKESKNFDDWL
jgi:ABC-2 type transport system permease protein